MSSEKVKEIKKALEYTIQVDLDKFSLGASLTDCLNLIDELEEENEWFKEKQSKAKEIMKSGELSKITKQDMYYYYLTNCGYLEKEIERQKQIVSDKGKVIKQFKDRLSELEDKIDTGTLIQLPCLAYNVKECRYQIVSTKNGRVYASKFYQDRREAEAKLKGLQNETS